MLIVSPKLVAAAVDAEAAASEGSDGNAQSTQLSH